MLKIKDNLKQKIKIEDSSIQIFLSLISKKNKKIVYFTRNHDESIQLKKNIRLFDLDVEVLTFPDFDCSFFSNISPTREVLHERINSLNRLSSSIKKRVILICSLSSIISKTIPREKFLKTKFCINNKTKNIYQYLKTYLNVNNYEFVDIVRNKGEYCVRGQIIDLFSPIEDLPVRILFNLDDVESMYFFDRHKQNNDRETNSYNLLPPSEIVFDEDTIKFFRESFRRCKIKNKDEFYKSISSNVIIPGSEQFFPILHSKFSPIFDYLDGFVFYIKEDVLDQYEEIYSALTQDIFQENEMILEKTDFFLKKHDFFKYLNNNLFNFTNFNADKNTSFFSEKITLSKNKKKNLIFLRQFINNKKSEKIFFCCNSKTSRIRFEKFFNESRISYSVSDNFNNLDDNFLYLLKLSLDSSFYIIIDDQKINFFSENDFFEKTSTKQTLKGISKDNIINEFTQLNLGDLVVHVDHGLGRFNGLKKKKIHAVDYEFIEILYHNDDKLLIPISNLELISRYGFSDKKVQLDKLGLQNWQQKKALLKNKIKEIAQELINTAAQRKLTNSINLKPNFYEYDQFSSAFEFTETSDQVRAIKQIEHDLQSEKPMDRLICGDVGFGKTEIAMRASFLVLSSGFQVVVICPKVLLVNQHFETFVKRFKGFNYNIEKISRFESYSEKKIIKDKLKLGLIDLIIGTHAILSSDVSFKNLGLIIIDEEQSFGVEQKEKLKKLKPNANILTLSATPIPRTLQSSLLNLRDISLIKTPPVNRLNIKTYLMIGEERLLKKIIENELKRKGQIFFVTPRIQDVLELEKRFKKLFKNLNYSVIHSKLNSSTIDKVYNDFFSKKTDLLLSTAMIESGLDISNVNTIIINKPYLFGLSQLYQLRGRVGRSSTQAYAYLLLEKNIPLTDNRMHKLNLISKINKLGAGFSIAANDLDIRGSGNIIGAEQSGHIKEVGIELYYKMLNETISELKNEKKVDSDWSPSINLGFSFNIPDNYIVNLDIRMQIYRRISGIKEIQELREVIKNLEDRFGKFPNLFENLFKIIEIKILCKKLNIKRVDKSKFGYVMELRNDQTIYIDKLINIAKLNSEKIKLLPKSKVMYKSMSIESDKNLNEFKVFLESLIEPN